MTFNQSDIAVGGTFSWTTECWEDVTSDPESSFSKELYLINSKLNCCGICQPHPGGMFLHWWPRIQSSLLGCQRWGGVGGVLEEHPAMKGSFQITYLQPFLRHVIGSVLIHVDVPRVITGSQMYGLHTALQSLPALLSHEWLKCQPFCLCLCRNDLSLLV